MFKQKDMSCMWGRECKLKRDPASIMNNNKTKIERSYAPEPMRRNIPSTLRNPPPIVARAAVVDVLEWPYEVAVGATADVLLLRPDAGI